MHRPSDQGSSGPFHYRLFGLDIQSDLPLSELRPVDPAGKPDVRIFLGDEAGDAEAVLAIDDVARFYVHGGSQIRVVPEPGVPDRNLRLFLLGSAMGMLLHQRGLLPLHANAVAIDGKAVAFMGPSGSGKSTLAAAFHDTGMQVVADDVCVVRFDAEGTPRVSSGLPRLRLWKDALDASGRAAEQFERSYTGDDSYEKYDVPVDAKGDSLELAAVYLLRPGDELAVHPLVGVKAVEAVFANTYRGGFIPEAGNLRVYWEDCLRLVGSAKIYDLALPRDHVRLPGLVQQVVAHSRTATQKP